MAHSIHLEHYLDSLESLPAELRRNLTLLRDLDERAEGLSGSLVREADRYSAEVAGLEASGRRHQLAAIDQLHTKLRELADDKVQLAIQTYELVDKHIRRLDSDLALFESEIKQKGLGARGRSTDESGKKAARKKSDGRRRRKSSSDEGSPPPQKRGRKSASGAAAAGEEGAAPTELSLGITHPSDVLDMPVDPNEPTYCLCHQVSYGEMIGCDNLDCPIEWFHFACVGLTTKPKGKWFCPKCNQDKKKK
ncbi:inhibitor of growth protein 4-like [Amphibalanus amphitrite]|uniref:inhibitor of growth protein 4-like n=1 Tax=Amphibalanus amphitrite TaxID=1232801 RepID=UPI001C90A4D1|nr:inhibitor of growth protein 4-like [Amphibalanus amphitrite]XP_043215198.1 inhibitor of growth protein 4-like [Amphibalanus amphitrite]XP_043215199.1 inhibitor of growth protein 4-like [Amphibalanus amphitrite]XP_043215200.1 inhibitor of growth protein 4-like [Amphibalanus amphitrite]XP_043215201.1 inhibitor of growth protein 4-like [Amphibalanus amphitrite]XP_043215203.1 inhibitor of growth protein 4-like [Amphibalanus amphitrite]